MSAGSSRVFTLDEASACYDDVQKWIMEQYPDSVAAKAYQDSIDRMTSGAVTYADDPTIEWGENNKIVWCYIYYPAIEGWQTVSWFPEYHEWPKPDNPDSFFASWEAPPQKASGEFEFTYTVNTDKKQTVAGEKVDEAVIDIKPVIKSGEIEGGHWELTLGDRQTVTTAGHTMDENFQNNGGDASASWTLHYGVEKESTTAESGKVGPYKTQAEADEAAEAEKNQAIARLQNEAQRMVDEALAKAKEQLASLQFMYDETELPHGYEMNTGIIGGHQMLTVPAGDENTEYPMKNDEWSLQAKIDKVDSETGRRIRGDSMFTIYMWDTVKQKYVSRGGYDQYGIERQADGTYTVKNYSGYAKGNPTTETLYYTQRNEGKFLIVEEQAPAGYYGDWLDAAHPDTAGAPFNKRAYAIEITKENNGRTIWLSNADYNADILSTNLGGTLVDTGRGVVTVNISRTPKQAFKTYITDRSGVAYNEDGRTVYPVADKFQNDRALGEIVLTKIDLDAARYVNVGGNGNASLDGAVYDLYTADDIHHPDGVTGIVDYSKITNADGTPIWHTTILTDSGWKNDHLPVLKKDHLVASAAVENGRLAFANLYLGRYYVVERATGVRMDLDRSGQVILSKTCPVLNRQLQPTGGTRPLTLNEAAEYTDYIYKNRYSAVAVSRAWNGSYTYDGYYLSFGTGYLCDELNHYTTITYADESGLVLRRELQSADEVLHSGFEVNKVVSTTGQPGPAIKLENAGFTVYRISDLSKADLFLRNPDGTWQIQSILDAYRAGRYDQAHAKYDFSGESRAQAAMYESCSDSVNQYNAALTNYGDLANGASTGWQPTGTPNQYRLGEVFTNDEGNLRVDGLAYGQYLVVEATVPKDLFQAAPFIVTVDKNAPQSTFCVPQGTVTTASGSFMTFTILDEEIEGYLQLIKYDAETCKPVKLARTAFSIFYLRDDGTQDKVEMNDPASGNATTKTSVFYTDAEGYMKTPEKLPLGRYRAVEVQGPEGYCNDRSYYVDFEVTSDRIYEVIGSSADDLNDYIITEKYINRETLGQLTLRKVGEVVKDYQNGQFVYQQDALGGAVYEIRAHGDIATPDHQTDADGNPTLWYRDGDLVATVTTAYDGQIDETEFAPTRTQATYDFLHVAHDGTRGEVTITLPLGTYEIREVKAPYGFTLNGETSYLVSLGWDNDTNDVVLAKTIVTAENGRERTEQYRVVNVKDANHKQLGDQKLIFENERVRPIYETGKIGVAIYKLDRDSVNLTDENPFRDGLKTDASLLAGGSNRAKIPADAVSVAGAVYELHTTDAIYSADGRLLAEAGALLGTVTTDENGRANFDVDVPIRGEFYGKDNTGFENTSLTNSGKYDLLEISVPDGYLNDQRRVPVEFVYENQTIEYQYVDALHSDKKTEVRFDKRGFANADKDKTFVLPGAEFTLTDWDGNVVDTWTSGSTPHVVRGLHLNHDFGGKDDLGKIYTLTETKVPDGYTTTGPIRFRLVQPRGENGYTEQSVQIYTLEQVPDAPVIYGSIVSTTEFADDADRLNVLEKIGRGIASLFAGDTAGEEDPSEAGVVIANWQFARKALTVTFTKQATGAAIEKCLRESDFAAYDVQHVVLKGGSAPHFFADRQCAALLEDAALHFTEQWVPAGTAPATLSVVNAPTLVTVSKSDITSHAEIAGAKLQITDEDGTVVEKWTSSDKPHRIEAKLAAGKTYTLTETLAPNEQGYIPARSIRFYVEDDGKIQAVHMQDDYTKLDVSKLEAGTDAGLAGAALKIVDANGKAVEEWTSDGTPHRIDHLPAGKYRLVEVSAPEGCFKAADVLFEVEAVGGVQTVSMTDDCTKLEISKTDIATGRELPGAVLRIVDSKGQTVAEWTSTGKPHRINKLPVGSYTLKEVSAPTGYLLAEDIPFEVADTGEIQKVEMQDSTVKTEMEISKIDAKTGKELPGAVLRVVDSKGKTVMEWTSTGTPHKTALLPVGRYTLKEVSAPAGYALAEDVSFEISAGETSKKIVMKDDVIRVDISKTDITTGAELPGATLCIVDSSGKTVEEWTSADTPHRIEKLPAGRYTLKEISAPDGYLLAEDVSFEVRATGEVQKVEMRDGRTQLEVSKIDAATGKELAGATLRIVDSSGKTIEEWVSTGTPHTLEKLPVGKYTLKELKAPDGYFLAEDVPFEVKSASTAYRVVMKNDYTRVEISKQDITTGKELPGARLEIRNAAGEVVERWTSTDTPHRFEKLPVGKYTLTETGAPDGYLFAEDVTFEVKATGEVQKAVMKDGYIRVEISKRDVTTGKELPGAHLKVVDADGRTVEEWTSDGTPHKIDRLPAGRYTLVETSAPDGYLVAESIEFTVKETLEIQRVTMEDGYTRVDISKTDITTGAELPGATLKIVNENGAAVEKWVSTDTSHRIERLPVGKYTLVEISAPDGYAVAENVPFEVRATGEIQKVVMEDERLQGEMEILKLDAATGEPLPGAKLRILDSSGDTVEEWASTDRPHKMELLPIGKYVLKEDSAPAGYVLAADIPFEITEDDIFKKIMMEDDVTKVDISKQDITTGRELPGATLRITDKDGNVIAEWVSTDTPHRMDRLPAGEYTLHEVTAPAGYLVAEDVLFTVKETSEIQRVEMKDDYTRVDISKQDITTGAELPGATLRITDRDGKTVEEWVSTGTPHRIERLPAGRYVLTEISAPAGYTVAGSIAFEVRSTGEIQKVTMQDAHIPEMPHTPKTGDLPWLPAVLGGVVVLALLCFALWQILEKRHRKSQ